MKYVIALLALLLPTLATAHTNPSLFKTYHMPNTVLQSVIKDLEKRPQAHYSYDASASDSLLFMNVGHGDRIIGHVVHRADPRVQFEMHCRMNSAGQAVESMLFTRSPYQFYHEADAPLFSEPPRTKGRGFSSDLMV